MTDSQTSFLFKNVKCQSCINFKRENFRLGSHSSHLHLEENIKMVIIDLVLLLKRPILHYFLYFLTFNSRHSWCQLGRKSAPYLLLCHSNSFIVDTYLYNLITDINKVYLPLFPPSKGMFCHREV